MPDTDEPPPDLGGDQGQSGIPRSAHARLRFALGRPIREVVNDVQTAGARDIFVQPDDGRFVIRGPKSREHIIESNGEHITSVRRPEAAHQARLRIATIRPATEDEIQTVKAFTQ